MKKIPTVYKRNLDNLKELTCIINDGCEWVFTEDCVGTRKYDGTCCMIKNKKLFKRREVKKNGAIPKDFIESSYDSVTGKRTGWLPCDPNEKADKYHFAGLGNMIEEDKLDGTYELVGPKIQGNPEGYKDYVLIKHSNAQNIELPFGIRFLDPKSQRKTIRDFLDYTEYEGIVFHHPDGRMAKIKKKDIFMQSDVDQQSC
tara:strand:- start:216 stop:815 length:600 start_codon:yes stop_codon:yes gene_type:complete